MADKIEIRVGVQNNVKAGMDGVVNDVERGAKKAKGSVEKQFTGKGFKEILSKSLQGDFAGALDDLQEKMGKKAEGVGVGIGVKLVAGMSAAVAGWQAGKKLDAMFGISDKLGGIFAGKMGEQEDKGLADQVKALKEARQERETADANHKAAIDALASATQKASEDKIEAIKAENAELANQSDMMRQIGENAQATADKFKAAYEAGFGGKNDPIRRMMGMGGGDQGEQANQALRQAMDKGADAEARSQERTADRLENRRKRRLAQSDQNLARSTGRTLDQFTDLKDLEGGLAKTTMPRWQRLALEAAMKDKIAAGNAQNALDHEREAMDAQIKSKDLLDAIRSNLDDINKQQAQLLQMK